MSLRTAFRHSYNTSALRLFQTVGVDTAFQYLDRFHFRSIVEKDHNYAASLGGLTYGVTALELADAYTSFIDGSYVLAHSIRKVTALDGTELYSWETQRDQIWSPKTVKYMRELLADVVANGTGQESTVIAAMLVPKQGQRMTIETIGLPDLMIPIQLPYGLDMISLNPCKN